MVLWRTSLLLQSLGEGGIVKVCSTPGCENPAAYRTRSKPAYCLECIDRIMGESGLVRLEPFTGPRDWMLTRCKRCGVEAHYRFEYILHKHEIGEPVCRACYWKQWFRDSWTQNGVGQGARGAIPEAVLLDVISACGYELHNVIPGDKVGEELYRVRCCSCGRISVERLGDIVWGCTCSKTTRQQRKACLKKLSSYARSETFVAMDDAVTGRNLFGPYHTVKEAMAALDEE